LLQIEVKKRPALVGPKTTEAENFLQKIDEKNIEFAKT